MEQYFENQCAAVEAPKIKNPEMPLRYQLEMELLASQNSRLFDQRSKLLNMVEKLQSEKLDKKVEDIGKKAISVEIISINKQSGSDNVYIARWRTKTFDNVTRKQIEKTYTGNFSITVNPSALTNEQDIVNNPLGLFVTDFSVSEENK